jgi:hypothetical protein
MNLRNETMRVLEKDFRPFIEHAIAKHPMVVDMKVTRGNVVTAHDYARRILIRARKFGIGKYTAAQVRACKPPLRVHYWAHGICFSGTNRKQEPAFRHPFTLVPAEDGEGRWLTLAVNPCADEILVLARLLLAGVLVSPIEIRSAVFNEVTVMAIFDNSVDLEGAFHVFKHGRNVMVWLKLVDAELLPSVANGTGKGKK